MSDDVSLCSLSSLHWYQTVFRWHGLTGELHDGLWTCTGQAPPYHSQALTRTRDGQEAQRAGVQQLHAQLGRGFSVADTWACLDLEPLGFRVLFEAAWMLREGKRPGPPPMGGGWNPVRTPTELGKWEEAWRRHGSPCESSVFLPAVLQEKDLMLYGAWRNGRVVAGCAANRTQGVVGFSNFFHAPEDDREAALGGALTQVEAFAKGLPLAGYEHGEAMDAWMLAGFRPVGPFRVWVG